MKTVKPDWIIADVVAQCPEAPASLILRCLMKAARAFSSTCINETWIDIPTQENVQHYPFERYLPEGFEVEYISEVMYNNCCIKCLDDNCRDWCTAGYIMDDLNHITLRQYCPGEDGCDTLRVKAVLRVSPDGCDLPKDMVDRFEVELFTGTMAHLLTMKGKQWTDFKAGEYYENQFKGDIASAKHLVGNKMNPEGCRIEAECLI